MTQYRVFIDDSTVAGQQTISGIQTQGNTFGVGISSDIIAGIVTATTFSGDGSQLSGIVAAGSGVVVKDDGVLVGTAATIDFGSNLTVSPISGGSVTITASGGGGSGIVIKDDDSLVGTATTINFGSNLSVSSISAGLVTVTATSSGAGIGTTGSINTTGIITASAFYGVGLPQNLRTNAYVLSSSDAGKHVAISTGGITLNSSIFDVGDVVTIYNDSEYSQGIAVGLGVTMRRVSIGDTGNRGLNAYGLATILCIGTDSYIISGAGVT